MSILVRLQAENVWNWIKLKKRLKSKFIIDFHTARTATIWLSTCLIIYKTYFPEDRFYLLELPCPKNVIIYFSKRVFFFYIFESTIIHAIEWQITLDKQKTSNFRFGHGMTVYKKAKFISCLQMRTKKKRDYKKIV